MKVAFRVDAGLQIGIGHVMRCLTLAEALKAQGADCHFISREQPGNLMDVVRQRGHAVTALTAGEISFATADDSLRPGHAAWLGCDWQTDSQETSAILARLQPEWLVVDHYAIDQRWELALRTHYRKLLVIDDLADRPHACDVLIDQNVGRLAAHYTHLVPARCDVLAGPEFALLRPEFAALRTVSLARPRDAIRKLLITMGGVDQPNATAAVLAALRQCSLPGDCEISVVMGRNAPWLEQIQTLSRQMPWPTEVLIDIDDIGHRMANSDLAIGAAGGTSWERCCLGLPTLIVVLAENQLSGARGLEAAHAACTVGEVGDIPARLPALLLALAQGGRLSAMGAIASTISDGAGVAKLIRAMELNDDD